MTIRTGVPIEVSIKKPNNTYLVTPSIVQWQGTKSATLYAMKDALNNFSHNPFYPKVKASVLTGILRVEVDYEWYYNQGYGDANDLVLQYSDGITLVKDKFSEGNLGTEHPNNTEPCFTITTQLPGSTLIPQVYTYFDSENKPPVYIYYDAEGQKQEVYTDY